MIPFRTARVGAGAERILRDAPTAEDAALEHALTIPLVNWAISLSGTGARLVLSVEVETVGANEQPVVIEVALESTATMQRIPALSEVA